MMREQFDNWFLLLLFIHMILQKDEVRTSLKRKNMKKVHGPILRVENNFVHS